MVIISNGFSKFHLSVAAEELHKRSKLSMFITGAYPTKEIRKFVNCRLLKKPRKLNRLLSRGQQIEENLVMPIIFPEFIHIFVQYFYKLHRCTRFSSLLNSAAFLQYGRQVKKHVLKAASGGALIYHYRAGFGHESVRAAKASGIVAICDFSIAHAALLDYLVNNLGQFPNSGVKTPINRFWSMVLRDAKQADYVLVNSDFVRRTFLHQNWDKKRVKVVYLGVDEQFLDALDSSPARKLDHAGPLQILFAGTFEQRKGVDIMVSAFKSLSGVDWRLTIAGVMNRKMYSKHKSFLQDPRVEYKGVLTREELAKYMQASEVFLFPSLAEGSARVIFESLAAGCCVITTPNSGSIVKNGDHGFLVPPGNEAAISQALRHAYNNRQEIDRIGTKNSYLIRSQYRQKHYGNHLISLYNQILH